MKKHGLILLVMALTLPLTSCGKTTAEGNKFTYSGVTILHTESCSGKELSKTEVKNYVSKEKDEYKEYYTGIYFSFGTDGKVETNYFTDVSLTETYDYENEDGVITILDNEENPLHAIFRDKKLYVEENEVVTENNEVRGVYYTVYK